MQSQNNFFRSKKGLEPLFCGIRFQQLFRSPGSLHWKR